MIIERTAKTRLTTITLLNTQTIFRKRLLLLAFQKYYSHVYSLEKTIF